MNFNNFGNQPMDGRSGSGRPPGNFPLTRQGSIYSLTFDELQTTMGSIGKDFGSMNMDELLKNIWNAEEMQTTGNNSGAGAGGANLQRQGSLTLPRTLSQKTVDEVWKDLSNTGFGEPDFPQRQQTLGEMTLEEFLVKAGVVREEIPLTNGGNCNEMFGGIGFPPNDGNGNQITFQSGVRSVQNQPPPLFPKPTNLPYGVPPLHPPPMAIQSSNQSNQSVIRNGIGNGNLIPMAGLGVTVAAESPAVSSDGLVKSNGGDTSSLSPAPYVFSGGFRGRKNGAIEKVMERRQRRMIKNRESAARSRARKQAYTMELEAEVSELKQKNQELKRKQEEILKKQKNQAMEMMNRQHVMKRNRLKKTISGPW